MANDQLITEAMHLKWQAMSGEDLTSFNFSILALGKERENERKIERGEEKVEEGERG